MKILIIHTFGLGDMIMFTPALQLLQKRYPEAKIDFLIFQKAAAEPIKYCPNLGTITYADFSLNSILENGLTLRKKRYDMSIVTSGTNPTKSKLFSYLIGAKIKIFEHTPIIQPTHRVENNMRLLNANEITTPHFCIDSNVDKSVFSKPNKISIGIHAGSNIAYKEKRWAKEKFVQLINLIQSQFDYEIFILSGPDEIEESKYIASQTHTTLISGKSLQEIAYIISNLDIMVNSDSGLGHIASCFDTKIFTIFGPAKEYMARPYSPNATSIKLNLECQPCYGKKPIKCNNECLVELSPQMVFQAMQSELNRA